MEEKISSLTPINGNVKVVTQTVIWLMIIAAVVTVVVVMVARSLLNGFGAFVNSRWKKKTPTPTAGN